MLSFFFMVRYRSDVVPYGGAGRVSAAAMFAPRAAYYAGRAARYGARGLYRYYQQQRPAAGAPQPYAQRSAARNYGGRGFGRINHRVPDKAYTPAVTSKRKTKKTKRKPALTARQRASVKRVAKNLDYVLVKSTKLCSFGSFITPYNEVARFNISNVSIAGEIAKCTWTKRDPAVAGALVPMTISPTLLNGQKFKCKRTMNLHLHNNSNMSGEVIIYLFKCEEYTTKTPFGELIDMLDSAYPVARIPIQDDFTQFESVPGQKRELWKMKKSWKMQIKGGENSSCFIDIGTQVIDVNRWIESASPTYGPGSWYIEARAVGSITHLNTVTTAASVTSPAHFNDQAVTAFPLDFRKDFTESYYVKEAGDVTNKYIKLAPTGLVTPSDAANVPISGDPEIPDVGIPDQA